MLIVWHNAIMGTRYLHFTIKTDSAERTPAGGLRVPAYISRTGVQTYRTTDGIRREYRPDEEVFSPETLDSFRGAAVTLGHPKGGRVDTGNWDDLAVGHLGDDLHADGIYTAGTIYIDRQDAVAQVESRKLVELSAGYQTDVIYESGVTADGEAYDARQTKIRGNHVALLPSGHGRAGREVRLRLDMADDEILEQEIVMDEPKESQLSLADVMSGLRSDVAEVVEKELAKMHELEGRVGELQARCDELASELEKANDPARIDALVTARIELVEKARKIDANVDVEGKTDREIMFSVMSNHVDASCSDDYLRGAFEARAAVTAETKKNDASDLAGPNAVPVTTSKLDEAEEQFNAARARGFVAA